MQNNIYVNPETLDYEGMKAEQEQKIEHLTAIFEALKKKCEILKQKLNDSDPDSVIEYHELCLQIMSVKKNLNAKKEIYLKHFPEHSKRDIFK